MKPSILALCILHCEFCILPAHAERTPEQIASDLFVLTNRIFRLEHGDDALEALPVWAEREGLSPDELSGELVLAVQALRGSTNRADRTVREWAVGALGFHGTANAVPHLESLVRSESGTVFDCAMNALVVLTKADAREIGEIHRIVTRDRGGDPGPLYGFYREMAHVLKWRDLDPGRASAIRTILLDTAETASDWSDVADEILCAHVSGYENSDVRIANLRRALSADGPAARRQRMAAAAAHLSGRSPEDPVSVPDPTVEYGPKYPPPSDDPPETE